MYASQCSCLLSTGVHELIIHHWWVLLLQGGLKLGGPGSNIWVILRISCSLILILAATVKRQGASCSGRRHNIRQPFPRIARPRSRRFVAQGVTSLSASPTASHSTCCELAQLESPPSAYCQSCVSAPVAAATMREVISIHIGQAGKSRRSVVCPDCADVKKHCLGTVACPVVSPTYKLRAKQSAGPMSKFNTR